MNAGPDVTRLIADWLAEELPTRAPDRILPATFERSRHTRQRRFGAARRTFTVNGNAPSLAVAAVIGMLVLVIGGIYLSNNGSGGVGSQPAATLSPTLAPTANPESTPGLVPALGPIEAGTYLMSDGLSDFRVTFPAGWDAAESGLDIRKNRDQPNELAFRVFSSYIRVYGDACKTHFPPVSTGPTADDLLAALAGQQSSDVSEPADVTIGGRPGVRLEVSVPEGLFLGNCHDIARIWSDGVGYLAFGPQTGTGTIYVVETSSGRLVLGADGEEPEASAADLAELQAIVDSIEFP